MCEMCWKWQVKFIQKGGVENSSKIDYGAAGMFQIQSPVQHGDAGFHIFSGRLLVNWEAIEYNLGHLSTLICASGICWNVVQSIARTVTM